MLVTANQPFGEWGKVFPDPAMTLAAIDRLVRPAFQPMKRVRERRLDYVALAANQVIAGNSKRLS